ncbi:MAG: lycopene cyclase domain-containing protein [Actinocatenispora sp.]
MPGEYTLAAFLAPALVIALELAVLRTGLLRSGRFWAATAVALGFQVPVDGWLTKLRAPVVLYGTSGNSGLRPLWDIPVEDFGFGFAMVGLTLLLWARNTRSHPARQFGPAVEEGGAGHG